ncbi:AcrR family transcriptional regulator [Gracilibacillus halotolerans]|uniref:AcrR family transcriptional regulator n=1 Tax=Gracilibacillus halotolerans TaxID=74386 RepID=A0A841RP94_9BACI|nr:TetR family transcriptional regulator [Gracilibacillus halotolerans]MBB6512478.1 AcrR family transcriptional regulator [Gracilibacillus halotolerans]
MSEPNTDLRVIRTRKLIMDSFMDLSGKKEFKDITVKDITAEAMINRATFYYHFEDIYDLLEKVLEEVLLLNLNSKNFVENQLDEETIKELFLAVTEFQQSLSNRCHRGYEDIIARIIREQLEVIFYKLLCKNKTSGTKETMKVPATMLSWGIYGASVEWRRNGNHVPAEDFIQSAIPYILSGVNS